jgi:hypothetical protein
MKRRHRRVLFNVFAFSLLGVSVYLNMFCMDNQNSLSFTAPAKKQGDLKQSIKIDKLSKIPAAKTSLVLKGS